MNKKEIESQYKYLDIIKWIEREKFIEEYLYDDILYSGKLDEKEIEEKRYSYTDWKEWDIVVEEWVCLDLNHNQIWDEWAKAIAEKLKLKRWVELDLGWNQIWAEWVEALSKMELKGWISLNLSLNQIWAEWAKVIAKNMKLKEWVCLNLSHNEIWPFV